jgi:type I restriction enzyme, S subunit
MSFPRYPEYKDSGVEWLGEVPAHWGVKRMSHLFALISSGTTPPNEDAESYGGDIYWVTTGELREDFISKTEKTVTESALAKFSALKVYPPGTLLMAMYGATIGRLGTLLVDASTNQACCALAAPIDTSVRFVFYALLAARDHLLLIASGGGQPNINQDKIRSLRIAAPAAAEQTTIAAFLDRETAKIDALVAEQETLIALLKEKRQAVISHAVTKGLNPDAPMKPSGIEWLGDVPAHWEVGQLKRMTSVITDGAHISPETEGGLFHFVSTRDLVDGAVCFEGALMTSASSYEYLVRTGCKPLVGDVLFSKDGTIGRTVVVREERDFVVASSLIIMRPEARLLNSEFLDCLCQSDAVQNQVDQFVKGAGLPRLSIQNLMKVFGVFPPLVEQEQIAAHLRVGGQSFELLIQKSYSGITLLKERRSALISAAVTGQIDVRGLAPA